MDPMRQLDQRGSPMNTGPSRGRHNNAGSSTASSPSSRSAGTKIVGSKDGTTKASSHRSIPTYSPLPSTSTMPLSLQHLSGSSAASSTDSLDTSTTIANASRSYVNRGPPANSGRTSAQGDRQQYTYVTTTAGRSPSDTPVSAASRPAPGFPLGRHDAKTAFTATTLNKDNSPSTGSATPTLPRRQNAPSIYSQSSARSTSSINSLPPLESTTISASLGSTNTGDIKGKNRSFWTNTRPVAVSSSKQRVPTEIEEAVRNLGLAPPSSPSRPPLSQKQSTSNLLSVPGASTTTSGHGEPLSRSPSADTRAASISDAASLTGTVASSSASLDQQSISAKSTKSSRKSAAPKRKQATNIKTGVSTGLTLGPVASSTSTDANVKKKKKKKLPLPTSSGKPAASTVRVPVAAAADTNNVNRDIPVASAPTRPSVNSPSSQTRNPSGVSVSEAVSRSPATGPQYSQTTSSLPTARTIVQTSTPQPIASTSSRNRTIDETASLRRFPPTNVQQHAPPPARNNRTANPVQSTSAAQSSQRLPSSVQLAAQILAREGHTTTQSSQTPAVTTESSGSREVVLNHDADEQPPPAWEPPLTTITLQFTPIHAYLSAYHDSVESGPIASTSNVPLIPDSPPPDFRSRPPSPELSENRPNLHGLNRRASTSEDSLPDIDLDTIEERSRGYASSENEFDLLSSQGRHAGTSTPPTEAPNSELPFIEYKSLRWQLRHWEAWRREGMSLDERLRRLTQDHRPPTPTHDLPDEIGQTRDDEPSALAEVREQSNPNLTVESSRAQRSTLEAEHEAPVRNATDASLSAPRLAPVATWHEPSRQRSPVHSDLSAPSGSNISNPRFPSVGTIRRARLKRFEVRRQNSRSMAAVVDTGAMASNDFSHSLADRSEHANAPPARRGASAERVEDSQDDMREQIRLARLAAVTDRLAEESSVLSPVADEQEGMPTGVHRASAEGNHDASPPQNAAAHSSMLSESLPNTVSRQGPHQLARQLAEQVAARQANAARSMTAVADVTCPDASIVSDATHAASELPSPSATSSALGDSSSSARPPTQTETAVAEPLVRQSSRISRLFRPNMGPRDQVSSATRRTQSPGEPQSNPVKPNHRSIANLLPMMTLPKAPPRITSDPLSTDNLRKLSRRQAQPSEPRITEAVASTSGSSAEGSDDDSATEPDDETASDSDSDSDSADDESTKKPASTIVSYPGGQAPPSVGNITSYASESDRQAAAASWRRTEDGRRHSALLSRPLSIKRKPPPVPPKRWGGVWDREAIQERLKHTFVQSDTNGGSSRHYSVMPGALPTLTENEPVWEVAGRDDNTSALHEPASWLTVGRETEVMHRSDEVHPSWMEVAQRMPLHQHAAQRLNTEFGRRPPPPLPRHAMKDVIAAESESTRGSTASALPGPRDRPASGTTLQRTPATRRPQSMQFQNGRRRSETSQQEPNSSPLRSPPSPEIRSHLNNRPRHVYSNSLPNSGIQRHPSLPISERVLTYSDSGSSEHHLGSVNDATASPSANDPFRSSFAPTIQTPAVPDQEYTDLEVMLASLDNDTPAQTKQILNEVLGVSAPATTEEIDSLPVGRVELERRRVDKKGKIKQKLSCVGINCNKCKICLQQFKEDELAVVLPVCLEVFHAEPCMRAYLTTNNKCPACQAALM